VKTNGYAVALVATSSREGAYFRGAIGSTLYVDQLKIVWK
ncbi:MAG: PCMD domain-containing protein, partial [Prevotellamassilia sp.]|nr:PCMD domain-containing protein [Prevotellamassilia sp.]